MSCAVGHRCGSDSQFPWLWHRSAAAVLIQPLAWELPYASGVALKNKTKQKDSLESFPKELNAEFALTSKGVSHVSQSMVWDPPKL